MISYNIFIKNRISSFNILAINSEDLKIVVDAYNKGSSDFFISGTRYWMKDLFEIKIFEFNHPERIKDFVLFAEKEGLVAQGILSSSYLPPEALVKGGKDVTREFISDAFGHLSSINNKKEENQNKTDESLKKIFISHSSKDKDKINPLIDLLENIGINHSQIFFLLIRHMGLISGKIFLNDLKKS